MKAIDQESNEAWSLTEFGHAKLGNQARTRRLVSMAQAAANKPAAKVTEIFRTSAEKEGAYKFLENESIQVGEVAKAAHIACARRCEGNNFVFIPVDGSDLSIKDSHRVKGLGSVGARCKKANGLHVMSAIAVLPDGTPMGICGQNYWSRPYKKPEMTKSQYKNKRPLQEKETRYWFKTIEQVQDVFREEAISCVPWYQLDRGGDFREMLAWAESTKARVTIRAAQNRCIFDEETKYLWETLEAQKALGSYTVKIPSGSKRKARMANIEVRAKKIIFQLKKRDSKKTFSCQLHAIFACEVGTTPHDEKPIEWLLLSNYEVHSFADACLILFGYTQRWRIEEFHKSWKSICRVEDSQLRDAGRIVLMSVILASVAMRIERLKYLARSNPDLPAAVEFNRYEIDTIILQHNPKGYKQGDMPTIGEIVFWVGCLGGYTGKSSGGPPGSIVIGRGLRYMQAGADLLEKISLKQN